MVKKIRIIVGNSPYKDNRGFGYSSLKVNELENKTLKDVYKDIPEIAFIPMIIDEEQMKNKKEEQEKIRVRMQEVYYKYLDVISFRRLYFLLFGGKFDLLKCTAEEIAEKFMNYGIYLINSCKDEEDKYLKNLIKKIVEKDKNEKYSIYILYVGDKAKELKDKLDKDKLDNCTINEYSISHPSSPNKSVSEKWINYKYKNNSKYYEEIKNIFRINLSDNETKNN